MNAPGTSVARPTVQVSIIICTFQRGESLERLLLSIERQITELTYEVVVVDNDPASRSCESQKIRYPGIRWIDEPRQGLSFARNTGVRAARGDVVVFADDDMEVSAQWLSALVLPVLWQGYDVCCGPVLPIKLETEAERLFEAYGAHGHKRGLAIFNRAWFDSRRLALPLWQVGIVGNSAVRRSAFQAHRGGEFDETLGVGTPTGSCEDLYFLYRLLRANGSIVRDPAAAVRHAHRETLSELSRQLCDYRRGEVAFCLLVLLRHGDLRGLSHLCTWIPIWRTRLLLEEIIRRLRGRQLFLFHMMALETSAYFSGPFVLIASMRRARRLRKEFAIDSEG
jgi:glycosyltransferase involved in cell wall biosynthesis